MNAGLSWVIAQKAFFRMAVIISKLEAVLE